MQMVNRKKQYAVVEIVGDAENDNNMQNSNEFVDEFVSVQEESFLGLDETIVPPPKNSALRNFVLMAVLFSANHGCVASALSLAVARLGSTGSLSSGILFFAYTFSAVLGATYVCEKLGARGALLLGMSLYCGYIACFLLATVYPFLEVPAAVIGAIVGGIGGGFLWTAQGSYFVDSSELYAKESDSLAATSTSFLAGVFAFIYLGFEISMKALSTELIKLGFTWGTVFGVYSGIAIIATFGMLLIHDLRDFVDRCDDDNDNTNEEGALVEEKSFLYKSFSAGRLLINDPKMKYMICLNASFGFAAAFLGSYVSGTVESAALNDENSEFVGALSAITACVAAVFSLIFGFIGTSSSSSTKKGIILTVGSVFFFLVAFPFVLESNLEKWGWKSLVLIYSFQGVGRATYEGTLRSVFADMFPQEKEGAFANIVLQNGLSGTIGYFVNASVTSPLPLEFIVMLSSILAVLGYWRASTIFSAEQRAISTPLI